MKLPLNQDYARFPERFYAKVMPTPVRAPSLIALNRELCAELGFDADALASPEGVAILAGNAIAEGTEPIALAYAGHQFGNFVPQLGDGRALLLGDVVSAERGVRFDIQLKGAGPTPFSRRGDGRAALGPVIREYIVSEAMAALGVPTTRALAAVLTGEIVYREERLPGAVFTRVASSHIRVGTFEFFAARGDAEALELLTQYALARHYPEVKTDNPALGLLDAVIGAQAKLIARWLGVGFVHGVMNTDNSSISGETIDYGPCAFLDEYRPDKKFSYIDTQKRYAFAQQPRIALWNLTRLAEALLSIVSDDEGRAVHLVTERLETFLERFHAEHAAIQRKKLGLTTEQPNDRPLVADLFERLAANEVDFTLFFRKLCDAAAAGSAEEHKTEDAKVGALFANPTAFEPWARKWRERTLAEKDVTPEARAKLMRSANPAFIPRNHQIESAIAAATQRQEFELFHRLCRVLQHPYADQPEHAELAEPPKVEERVTTTFCGT